MSRHYLTGRSIPTIKEYVYGIKVKREVTVNIHANRDKEHTEYVWVSYKEALSMLKWDDNKRALQALQ